MQTLDIHLAVVHAAPAGGIDYDDLAVRLRLRGSSSARLYDKKSFALRTLDQSANLSTAEDNKVSLLGEWFIGCPVHLDGLQGMLWFGTGSITH
jgi:hypothetical protein